MSKPCRACGASDRRADGKCRPCGLAHNRKYYAANKEKHAEAVRKYREENKEMVAKRHQEYYVENQEKIIARVKQRSVDILNGKHPALMIKPCVKCGNVDRSANGKCRVCVREYNRKWRSANPEKTTKLGRAWRKANPEKVAELKRKYHERHPERNLERSRKWAKENPSKVAAVMHKRRMKKYANGGNLSPDNIKAIYTAYPNCLACGTCDSLSLDHVIPIACGGRNSIENIQVLCRSCNSRKHTRTTDYRERSLGGWRQMRLIRGANG